MIGTFKNMMLHVTAALLIVAAALSLALACSGEDGAIEVMKYYAAIATVGAFAVYGVYGAWRVRRRLPLVFVHLGFALVLGGWVYNEFYAPPEGYLHLRAGQAGRVAEKGAPDTRGFVLTVNDFAIDRWPDTGTVRQYTSTVEVETTEANGVVVRRPDTISVNHPLRGDGWWVYQNSYDELQNPHTGEPLLFTILLCVKDVGLPFVAMGALLLLIGTLVFAWPGASTRLRQSRLQEDVLFPRGRDCPNRVLPALRLLLVGYGIVALGTLAMLVHRTLSTGHAPLQNMYEFLMCAAAFIPMLTFAGLRTCSPAEGIRMLLVDSALLAVVMIPVCFVMDGRVKHLMPALQSPFFIPHVGAYVIGYLVLVRTSFGVGRKLVGFGYFLLTLGLVLGATWGKVCWGHWWQFDPKEMWSLATWFVYAAYFHLRPHLSRRAETAFLVAGAVMIVLTLTWINLSRLFTGIHSYA